MTDLLPLGTLLQGRYRIIEAVGEGGSGRVYRAERIGTRPIITVAVKQYGSDLGEAAIAQLENEVNALFDLTHAALPRIYDFFQDGQNWYLVSEYVDGRSVEERLSEGEDIGPRGAAELGLQLAEVLRYVAGRGLVHRDVKPGNMLISSDGQLKLIDFGLAGQAEQALLGDPQVYGFSEMVAAPEQRAGLPTDVRSDIYSFGATLSYILTQQEPQPTEATRKTRIVDARLGGELGLIIEKCLRYEQVDRYQTWDEVIESLNSYLAEPTRRRRRKTGSLTMFLVGLLIGAMALGSATMVYMRFHNPPPVMPPEPSVPAIVAPTNAQIGVPIDLSLSNVGPGDYRWEFRDTQKPDRVMQVLNGQQVQFSPTDVGVFDVTVNGSGLSNPLQQRIEVSQGLNVSPVVSLGSSGWVWPTPSYLGRDKKLSYEFAVTDPQGQKTTYSGSSFQLKYSLEGAYQIDMTTQVTGSGITPVTVRMTQVVQSVKYLILPADKILNQNASFESAAADGSPLGWQFQGESTWDKKNAVEGTRSIRFGTLAAYTMESVKLTKGAKYRLSVWVKGDGLHLNKPAVQLKFRSRYSEQFVRSDIVSTTPIGGTFDWKIVIVEFTAPGNVDSNLEMYLVFDGSGTIWFDMCALERLDD